MKAEDLKTKTEDELKKLLLDTRKNQLNMRFQKSNATLTNTSDMRKARRTVARIKTFLTMQKNEAATPKATKAPAKKATTKTTKTKAA